MNLRGSWHMDYRTKMVIDQYLSLSCNAWILICVIENSCNIWICEVIYPEAYTISFSWFLLHSTVEQWRELFPKQSIFLVFLQRNVFFHKLISIIRSNACIIPCFPSAMIQLHLVLLSPKMHIYLTCSLEKETYLTQRINSCTSRLV